MAEKQYLVTLPEEPQGGATLHREVGRVSVEGETVEDILSLLLDMFGYGEEVEEGCNCEERVVEKVVEKHYYNNWPYWPSYPIPLAPSTPYKITYSDGTGNGTWTATNNAKVSLSWDQK